MRAASPWARTNRPARRGLLHRRPVDAAADRHGDRQALGPPAAHGPVDAHLLLGGPGAHVEHEVRRGGHGVGRRPGAQDRGGHRGAGARIGPVRRREGQLGGGEQGVDAALGIEAGVRGPPGEVDGVPGGALARGLQRAVDGGLEHQDGLGARARRADQPARGVRADLLVRGEQHADARLLRQRRPGRAPPSPARRRPSCRTRRARAAARRRGRTGSRASDPSGQTVSRWPRSSTRGWSGPQRQTGRPPCSSIRAGSGTQPSKMPTASCTTAAAGVDVLARRLRAHERLDGVDHRRQQRLRTSEQVGLGHVCLSQSLRWSGDGLVCGGRSRPSRGEGRRRGPLPDRP